MKRKRFISLIKCNSLKNKKAEDVLIALTQSVRRKWVLCILYIFEWRDILNPTRSFEWRTAALRWSNLRRLHHTFMELIAQFRTQWPPLCSKSLFLLKHTKQRGKQFVLHLTLNFRVQCALIMNDRMNRGAAGTWWSADDFKVAYFAHHIKIRN